MLKVQGLQSDVHIAESVFRFFEHQFGQIEGHLLIFPLHWLQGHPCLAHLRAKVASVEVLSQICCVGSQFAVRGWGYTAVIQVVSLVYG